MTDTKKRRVTDPDDVTARLEMKELLDLLWRHGIHHLDDGGVAFRKAGEEREAGPFMDGASEEMTVFPSEAYALSVARDLLPELHTCLRLALTKLYNHGHTVNEPEIARMVDAIERFEPWPHTRSDR